MVHHSIHSSLFHLSCLGITYFFQVLYKYLWPVYIPSLSSQPSDSKFGLHVICQQSCFMGCMQVSSVFLIYLVAIKKVIQVLFLI